MPAGRPREWTDEKIEEEAKFLIEWSELPEALTLGTCFMLRKYSYTDALEWCERNSKFREAREQAETNIGQRREVGALISRLNGGIVNKTLGAYNPMYEQYFEKQRKQEYDERFNEDICKAINDLINQSAAVVDSVEKTP